MATDPTQATYNRAASDFANFFAGFGSRSDDVGQAFSLVKTGNPSLNTLELGCGDGRDAGEIFAYTDTYEGIDYAEGLIELARAKYPEHSRYLPHVTYHRDICTNSLCFFTSIFCILI